MMQVTAEEGIIIEDYVAYQKALFLDLVFLHPDGPKTKKAPPGYRVGLQSSSD
jgi:hypothetical protein